MKLIQPAIGAKNATLQNTKTMFPHQTAGTTLTGNYSRQATEYVGNYDVGFLDFCQSNLPDAFSFWVMDVDSFVIRSRTGRLMLLEIKRNGYACKEYQARSIAILDALISAGVKSKKGKVVLKENGKRRKYGVSWHGYNVLTLSADRFDNSRFLWNGVEITREALIGKLAIED